MEFHEKLRQLRTREHLTQEELAAKLYVSRTAISKWESGRGYPSIESLKMIARYFHVTIDELIGEEEIVTLAQQEISASRKKLSGLMCGILDCLMILLLILPVFGDDVADGVSSVSVFALSGVSQWLKIVFVVTVGVTVLNGFCTVISHSLEKQVVSKYLLIEGIVLSIIAAMLFVLARQPYAGFFALCILVMKGYLWWKSH